MTLKVMAGDKIDVLGKSYYFQNTSGTAGNSPLPVLDLLNAFLSSPASVGTSHGISGSSINVPAGVTGISSMVTQQTSQSNASPTKPRAFINVVFFDEQFKTYDGGFSISMVGSNSVVKDHYSELQNLVANKSGYVYIYCSNESPVNVFFDNIQVVHTKGPIVEETHYYPFGLTMSGISSKAAGIKPNKEQTFQDQRFDDEFDLNWVQFKWRNHDPQIGRFIEIDPLSNDYVYNSTYAFSENKVTAHVELEGLESVPYFAKLWRSAGFSSSSNPKEFVSNVGKEALKPKTWVAGYAAAGQIAAPFVLTTIFSGGFGGGVIVQAEARTLSMEVSATTVSRTQTRTTTGVGSATTMEGNSTTIYRGINENHVGYLDAKSGITTPQGGSATAMEHNLGNTQSKFTSWTLNEEVAKNYALRPGGGGVILQKTVPNSSIIISPSLKSVNLMQSPGTVVNESEVLIKGKIIGAKAHMISAIY